MQRQSNKKTILGNSDGFAVVEATFVFPIMFMIFFALVMLAFYLPQRAMLQRATQYAATAVATELGDTWIYYDGDSQAFGRYADHKALTVGKGGVYVTLFKSVFVNNNGGAETIVEDLDEKENMPIIANGDLMVECDIVNYVVYKEVVVTATRTITVPIDMSVIQFPQKVELVVTSKAVVQNSDEFIRNVDMAVNFVKRFEGVEKVFKKLGEARDKISNFFGI